MTAYMLCEIAREAGLRMEFSNVVHGTGPDVGSAITAHPKLKAKPFLKNGAALGATLRPVAVPRSNEMVLHASDGPVIAEPTSGPCVDDVENSIRRPASRAISHNM